MKADDRKKQILDAAVKAFAEHGYERASIAIICKEAGIARPTLYQYFNDKRSLFRELLEGYLLGMNEKIHARQAAKDDGKVLSKREILNSLHNVLFEEIMNNRDIYMIIIKEARARNAETQDIVHGIMHTMISEFECEMQSEFIGEKAVFTDHEFAAVYVLGGTIQAIEYFLFDREREMTTKEFAEKITEIESKLFDFDHEEALKP
ncbi:MAG: helix-turn-helix domain-containing protein [bacterium]